jgi:hypothetical protein
MDCHLLIFLPCFLKLEAIDYKRSVANYELQKMNNQIAYLQANMSQLSAACDIKRNEIAYLNFGIQALEGHINNRLNDDNQQQQQKIGNK